MPVDATRSASAHARLLAATLLAPAVVFALLTEEVMEGARLSWDGSVRRLIESAVGDVGTPVTATVLVEVAALAGAAALATGVLVLIRRRRVRELAFLALAIGGMLALDPLLKAIVQRPPVSPDGTGYSFPSGTAMVSFAVAGAAVVLLRSRPLRLLAALGGGLVAIALGASVVHLDWHYPSDVVAGWCLALGWLSLLWLVLLSPAARSRGDAGAPVY
jgi:membrane-associated phospholipid phosphatase